MNDHQFLDAYVSIPDSLLRTLCKIASVLTQPTRQTPRTTRYASEAYPQSPYEPGYNIKVKLPTNFT